MFQAAQSLSLTIWGLSHHNSNVPHPPDFPGPSLYVILINMLKVITIPNDEIGIYNYQKTFKNTNLWVWSNTHTHRIQFVCVWAHACAIACTKWQVLQIPWRSETSPSNNPLFYTDDQNPYQLSLAYIPYLSYPYNWVPKSTWLWFIVGPIVEN